MIAGLSLDKLGEMIIEQNAQKRDLVVPTQKLTMLATNRDVPALAFSFNGQEIVADLTQHTTRQLGTWAGIPAKYFDLLTKEQNRSLLEENVNHWLQQNNERRMVRMFQNGHTVARAFLSEKFRPLDNYDLAANIMPRLKAAGMEIKSANLSENRLHIQAIDTRLTAKIQPGKHQRTLDDTVYGGVVISNSETGAGALAIEQLLYRLVCTNGMIVGTTLRKSHLGRGFGDSDDVFEILSDETKAKNDEAFWATVQDILHHALSESKFQAVVNKFQAATEIELPMDPQHVIDVTARKLDLNDGEKDAVLRAFFADGDPTLYGLANAVTRSAEDHSNYDRAIEIERLGSDVLTFDPAEFSKN